MAKELPGAPRPIADLDLAYEDGLSRDLTVAARALVLGAALHAPEAVEAQSPEVAAIGIRELPPPVRDVGNYDDLIAASSKKLGEYGYLRAAVEQFEALHSRFGPQSSIHEVPSELTREATTTGDPAAAIAWLRATQSLERGAPQAAASAAIDPQPGSSDSVSANLDDRPIRQVGVARSLLTDYSSRSAAVGGLTTAVVAREIADAALGAVPDDGDSESIWQGPGSPIDHPSASISTIVHGTAAYPGSWWTPGGDFHNYVREHVTPDLYSGGQYYSWSGKYSPHHRDVAASRLRDWARPYLSHLNTVYAHSYGGMIALRALGLGLHIDELVLLSAPNEQVETDLSRVGRITSLRIHMDLVLLAARRRQSFDLPVAEHYLPRWFTSHGDSHESSAWIQHDVVRAMSIGTLR